MKKIILAWMIILLGTLVYGADDEVFKHHSKDLGYKILGRSNGKIHIRLFRIWHDDVHLGGDKNVTTSITHQEIIGEMEVTAAELNNLNLIKQKIGKVKTK